MITKKLLLFIFSAFAIMQESSAEEVEVFTFVTQISDYGPEANIAILNKSNKKVDLLIRWEPQITESECGFVLPPLTEHFIDRSEARDSYSYKVSLNPGALTMSYLSLDKKDGLTKLPCSLKYKITSLKKGGKILGSEISGILRIASELTYKDTSNSISSEDLKIIGMAVEKNYFTSSVSIGTLVENKNIQFSMLYMRKELNDECPADIVPNKYIDKKSVEILIGQAKYIALYTTIAPKLNQSFEKVKCVLHISLFNKVSKENIFSEYFSIGVTSIFWDNRFNPHFGYLPPMESN